MGRKKGRHPLIEGLEIADAGAEGKAIGRFGEKVVFVPYVVPGDVVDVQVTKKRKNYLEGRVTKIHTKSEKRVTPVCSHFGICGGCKWQNLGYEDQLFYKQKQVKDHLTRIGKIELPEIQPIVGAPATEYYRNKLEFTFAHSRWVTEDEIATNDEIAERRGVGFHIPGRFDKILDVDHCYLQGEPSNAVRLAIKAFAMDNNLSFYNLREHTGLLRNLIIRTTNTKQLMVLVCFGELQEDNIALVMEHLKGKFPEITSLMYVVNTKQNDTIYDLDVKCFAGNDHIVEEMEGLKFKIGPKSFFQTNSTMALKLYEITRDFANIKDEDVVYDLYTGTGTIANFVAKNAKHVVGIESVPEAIEDAKLNSKNNGIANASFYAGDMKDIFTAEFIAENGKPDVIITDPPRAGMHTNVIEVMLELEAARIVYVSCNAATQARDLQLLDPKYKVTKVQPLDMFPHTHHVENVVVLELRN